MLTPSRVQTAMDELSSCNPLVPDAAATAPSEPARRLRLPPSNANAPTEPVEPQSAIEARVAAWEGGKNLQSMLSSLHEIAPRSVRWEPCSLGALLGEAQLKDAYKLALLAVHPDKLADRPDHERARCQLIFNALRKANKAASQGA